MLSNTWHASSLILWGGFFNIISRQTLKCLFGLLYIALIRSGKYSFLGEKQNMLATLAVRPHIEPWYWRSLNSRKWWPLPNILWASSLHWHPPTRRPTWSYCSGKAPLWYEEWPRGTVCCGKVKGEYLEFHPAISFSWEVTSGQEHGVLDQGLNLHLHQIAALCISLDLPLEWCPWWYVAN